MLRSICNFVLIWMGTPSSEADQDLQSGLSQLSDVDCGRGSNCRCKCELGPANGNFAVTSHLQFAPQIAQGMSEA